MTRVVDLSRVRFNANKSRHERVNNYCEIVLELNPSSVNLLVNETTMICLYGVSIPESLLLLHIQLVDTLLFRTAKYNTIVVVFRSKDLCFAEIFQTYCSFDK